jgi:hypothetical protein
MVKLTHPSKRFKKNKSLFIKGLIIVLAVRCRVDDKWDLGVFFSRLSTIKPGASLPGQKLKIILDAGHHQSL